MKRRRLWICVVIRQSVLCEGRELKKQLNERLGELKALLDVERFTNKQTDDGSEFSPDGDFSSIGLFDDDEEISSAVKCKRLSTLAEVTVGTATEHQDKTRQSGELNRQIDWAPTWH